MTWRLKNTNNIHGAALSSTGFKNITYVNIRLSFSWVTRSRALDLRFLWFDNYGSTTIVRTIYSLVCCFYFLPQRSFSVTASTMGFGFNSTVLPAHDAWSGYLAEVHQYLPDSTPRVVLLAFINIPVIAIVLNVLRQLVRLRGSLLRCIPVMPRRSCLKTRCYPRKSSTSYRLWVPHQATGMILLRSLSLVGKR